MTIQWNLVLFVILPCLSSGSIFTSLRKSLKNVQHFEQDERERPGTLSAAQNLMKRPAFCNKLDCPEFKVLEDKPGYQLREYEASRWVSTNSVGISYKTALDNDFMLLFDYISGKNKAGKKIAMTAPVLNRIIPGQGPACENNFTMSFFVAPSERTPPEPTDSKVFLSQMRKMQVYVRSFPGFAREEKKWVDEAEKLAKALPSSASYIKEYYYTAGYNSPFQLLDRHNEIWFIAK